MIKFNKPKRTIVYDLKSIDFSMDFQFLIWIFSIMYDSIFFNSETILNDKISKFYKKIVNTKNELKFFLKTIVKLISEHQIKMSLLKVKTSKKKMVNKSKWFLNYYTVPYQVKSNKLNFFNFNYMWSNIWSSASFFFSSFSKLRYAWIYFKNSRSNYFGSFYYTGAIHKFLEPDNVSELNENHNPYFAKIVPKRKHTIPYKMHPYVSYAASPYCYVTTSCTSGSLGFQKKARRSKDVFKKMRDYFNVFFVYYFSFYKIDFLFFRLNGFYRILKFFKAQIFKQFKNNFFNLKKTYKKSLTLKKTIQIYEYNRDAYPSLLTNLVALMGGHDITKPYPEDKETTEYLAKSMSQSDTKFDIKKSKLRRMIMKILYYTSQFPKFIYIVDTTTYPFNGCRRVRHYKK